MPTIQELRTVFSAEDKGFSSTAEKAGKAVDKLKEGSEKAEKSAGGLQKTLTAMAGQMGGVATSATSLSSSLKAVHQSASGSSLKTMEENLKKLGSSATTTEGKISKLASQVSVLHAALGKGSSSGLDEGIKKTGSSSVSTETKITKLTKQLNALMGAMGKGGGKEFGAGLEKAGTDAGNSEGKVNKLTEQVKKLREQLTAAKKESSELKVPEAKGGEGKSHGGHKSEGGGEKKEKGDTVEKMKSVAESIEKAADKVHEFAESSNEISESFGVAMAKVKVDAGLSGKGFEEMKQQVLTASKTFGIMPDKAAEAMSKIQASGLHGKEAMNLFNLSCKAAVTGIDGTNDAASQAEKYLNGQGAAASKVNATYAAMPESFIKNKQAMADMGVTQVGLGEGMEASNVKAAEMKSKFNDLFQNLPQPIKDAAAQVMGMSDGIGKLAGGFGNLLPVIGDLMPEIGEIGPALAGILPEALPIIAVIAAIGGAIALGVVAWQNNFGGFRDTVQNVINTIKAGWEKVWPKLVYVFNAAKDTIIEGWNAIKPYVEAFFKFCLGWYEKYVKWVVDNIVKVVDSWATGIAVIRGLFKNGMEGMKALISALTEFVIYKVADMASTALTAFQKVIMGVKDFLAQIPLVGQKIADSIPSLQGQIDQVNALKGATKGLYDMNMGTVRNAIGTSMADLANTKGGGDSNDGGKDKKGKEKTNTVTNPTDFLGHGGGGGGGGGGGNGGSGGGGDCCCKCEGGSGGDDGSQVDPQKLTKTMFEKFEEGFRNPGPHGKAACALGASYILEHYTKGLKIDGGHPISSAAGLRDYMKSLTGKGVGVDQAQIGALAYKKGSGPSGAHVGIYIGNGEVLDMNGGGRARNTWGVRHDAKRWKFANIPAQNMDPEFLKKMGLDPTTIQAGVQAAAQVGGKDKQTPAPDPLMVEATKKLEDLTTSWRLMGSKDETEKMKDQYVSGAMASPEAQKKAMEAMLAKVTPQVIAEAEKLTGQKVKNKDGSFNPESQATIYAVQRQMIETGKEDSNKDTLMQLAKSFSLLGVNTDSLTMQQQMLRDEFKTTEERTKDMADELSKVPQKAKEDAAKSLGITLGQNTADDQKALILALKTLNLTFIKEQEDKKAQISDLGAMAEQLQARKAGLDKKPFDALAYEAKNGPQAGLDQQLSAISEAKKLIDPAYMDKARAITSPKPPEMDPIKYDDFVTDLAFKLMQKDDSAKADKDKSEKEFTKSMGDLQKQIDSIGHIKTIDEQVAGFKQDLIKTNDDRAESGKWSTQHIEDMANKQKELLIDEQNKTYADNYNSAIKDLTKSLEGYSVMTRQARVDALAMDGEHVRMRKEDAAAVIDYQDQVEKYKQKRDEMKGVVDALSDAIGAGMRDANKGLGAGFKAMIQTLDQSLRDMVLKILQSNIQKSLMKAFGLDSNKDAPQAPASQGGGTTSQGGGGGSTGGGDMSSMVANMIPGAGQAMGMLQKVGLGGMAKGLMSSLFGSKGGKAKPGAGVGASMAEAAGAGKGDSGLSAALGAAAAAATSFSNALNSVVSSLQDAAQSISDAADEISQAAASAGGGGDGLDFSQFASGGMALPGSMALVGEAGPELMYLPPSGGAHVYNNRQSRSMTMGGDTHMHNYNVSVAMPHGMNDDDARRSGRALGRSIATQLHRSQTTHR